MLRGRSTGREYVDESKVKRKKKEVTILTLIVHLNNLKMKEKSNN